MSELDAMEEELHGLFYNMDKDKDGAISVQELAALLKSMGMETSIDTINSNIDQGKLRSPITFRIFLNWFINTFG